MQGGPEREVNPNPGDSHLPDLSGAEFSPQGVEPEESPEHEESRASAPEGDYALPDALEGEQIAVPPVVAEETQGANAPAPESPSEEAPTDSPEAPKQPSELSTRMKELGETGRLAGAVVAVATAELAKSGGRVAGAALSQLRRFTGRKVQEAKDETQRVASDVLHSVSVDPDKEKSIVRQLIQILPGIGASTEYADAWRKFHEGRSKSDDAMVQAARKECLVALADGGIDVMFLGSGKVFRGIALAAKKASGSLLLTRAARKVGIPELDFIETGAAKAASTERGKRIADTLLNLVQPNMQPGAEVAQDLQDTLERIVDETDGINPDDAELKDED